MLADFSKLYPAHKQKVADLFKTTPPKSSHKALRLCERWAGAAKISLDFAVKQGQVAMSTHAGVPWLHQLREELGDSVCFWPFNSCLPQLGQNLIAEVYPARFKGRSEEFESSDEDERDAFRVCRWLQERDQTGCLGPYLKLETLTTDERELARREGWILGVL